MLRRLARTIGIGVACTIAASSHSIAWARAAAGDPPEFETLASLGRYLSGYNPDGPLIADSEGRLYGVNSHGGHHGGGTLFRVRPDGSNFRDLFHFDGPTTGSRPSGTLTLASDGLLYGTTFLGGSGSAGTVWSVATDGSGFRVLDEFDGGLLGGTPTAGVIEGLDGALYGTNSTGGTSGGGTLFRLQRDGSSIQVLIHFDAASTGDSPAGLLQTADGTLHGSTSFGGPSATSFGTLYQVQPDGSGYTLLVDFDDSMDAWEPSAPSLLALDGCLYGTAAGGNFGDGIVYRVATDGSDFTAVVHGKASTIGEQWSPPLLQAPDGTFFAVALGGGSHLAGTAVRFRPDGTGITKLLDFDPALHGKNPRGGVRLREDGALIGLTWKAGPQSRAFGTMYELASDGSHAAVLRTFTDATVGSFASSALVEGMDGRFYGLTQQGGVNGHGTLFRIRSDGSDLEVLHDFHDTTTGSLPAGPLALGTEGVLFGITEAGGPGGWGTAFRFEPDGHGFETIAEFSAATRATNGVLPRGGLLLAADGMLYGACWTGGAHDGGTLFRIDGDGGSFAVLHAFAPRLDGLGVEMPLGALLQGSDGALYGTTDSSPLGNDGAVFRIECDGSSYATLFVFKFFANASTPSAGLVEIADGSLVGTVALIPAGSGAVFKLHRDGTGYEILHQLTNLEGNAPRSTLVELPDGRLCGTAQKGGTDGDGTLFALSPDGSNFTVLHDFEDSADGSDLWHEVTVGSDGNLHGVARRGGDLGQGTVFRVLLDNGDAFSSSYGAGFPGTLGVPTLAAQTPPILGTTLLVDVGNSAGSATLAALLVGSNPISIPLAKGGDLLVAPLLTMLLALPAEGMTLDTDLVDDPGLSGLEFFAQVLLLDSGAARGQSTSAGLKLHLGY